MSIDIEQAKIEREQNAWRILRLMLQYRGVVDWTRELLTHELKIIESQTQTSLAWLYAHGLVETRGKKWYTANGAKNAYDEYTHQKIFNTGQIENEFRFEVLTGMTPNGKKSKITWAAMPSAYRLFSTGNKAEDVAISQCIKNRRIKEIANEIGLSEDETYRGLETGSVKYCRGTDNNPHWGIFNPKKNGWQYICRNCMCEKLKKIRAQKKKERK